MSFQAANRHLIETSRIFGEIKIKLETEAELTIGTRDAIVGELDKMLKSIGDYRKLHNDALEGLDTIEGGLKGAISAIGEHSTKHAETMKALADRAEDAEKPKDQDEAPKGEDDEPEELPSLHLVRRDEEPAREETPTGEEAA